jgi:hypothetical protein
MNNILKMNYSFMSYPVLGVIFVFDLMLLPMFHIGLISWKISLLIIGFWSILLLAKRADYKEVCHNNDMIVMAIILFVVIISSLLGEILLRINFDVIPSNEVYKGTALYVLMLLSFGFGLKMKNFNVNFILIIFYLSVIINIVFIYFGSYLPFIFDIYYDQESLSKFSVHGVTSVEGFFEMERPYGVFGNPNVSMLQVNTILLFIVLLVKYGHLHTSKFDSFFILVAPVSLATILGSKSQFIVSIILITAYIHFHWIKRLISDKIISISFYLIMTLLTILMIATFDDVLADALKGFGRISEFQLLFDSSANDAKNFLRPIMALEYVLERFKWSPIVGSGYSSVSFFPFDWETQYYHNDWFRLLISSGLLGFLSFVILIKRFMLPLGMVAVVLFIIPGMTNTFMLILPSTMFYFFMVGVMHEKNRQIGWRK